MNVLEKILEEIHEKMLSYRSILKTEVGGRSICEIRNRISELNWTKKIIISHLDEVRWIPCSERLPEDGEEMMLVQVSGRPTKNIWLDNAFEFAVYSEKDGWMVDNYPEWEKPDVIAWQPLPEPYNPKEITTAGREHIMSRFTKVE